MLRKQKAFTLIEIVVAVAIFGIIVAIIFPALLQFLDMRERVNEQHEKVSNLQKTFLFLTNDLRFASNRVSKDNFGDSSKTTFIIEDGSLIEFTASYPDLALKGLNVPRRIRWVIEDKVLKRVQYPVLDPDSDTRKIVQSLLKDVRDIEVKIWRIEGSRDSESKKWDEQDRLPDLVEITIELDNNIEYRRVISMLSGAS